MLPPNFSLIHAHIITIQNMDPSTEIHCLTLLVCEASSGGDLKNHYALTIIAYCFYLGVCSGYVHIPDFFPLGIKPSDTPVVAITIAYIVVILRPVRPGLLFMLGVERVVPAWVGDEGSVDPRCMYPSYSTCVLRGGRRNLNLRTLTPKILTPRILRDLRDRKTMNIRIRRNPHEIGAYYRIPRQQRVIAIKVVIPQTGFAIAVGEEERKRRERHKPGIGEVLKG